MTTPTQLSASLTGRYEVEREIGRGGMATVYLARDVRHNRRVALKVLNPELGAVLGIERFLAEIQVTANLQHPNLLPLFDSGEANGLLFYVMPFVEGESLRARLEREKQLPVDEAIRIATGVASALEYAHAQGVIHRDLKPENVLLQSGQPVVADFGIALAVSNAGGTRVTQTGLSLGTPQYMSPEQATGDRVIDGRADLYSLAALTYEMLAGEPPHTGNTMQAIIARVLTEAPRSVSAMRPNVPEHVEAALERGLEKLPADRWPSAREFADALNGRSVSSASRRKATSAVAVRTRRGWRSRLADPVVLVLAAVTLASLLVTGRLARDARRPADTRQTVRFPLTLPNDVVAATGIVRTLSLSDDGSRVAFAARGATGVQQIYLRPVNDTVVRPVAGTDGAVASFFSPDGKWLAFMTGSHLRKVDLGTGTVLTLADLAGLYFGGSWTKRGDIVVATGVGRISVIPENGGPPRRVCPPGAIFEAGPLVLPDDQTVAYSSWPTQDMSSARLSLASLRDGTCTVLDVPGVEALGYLDGYLVYLTNNGTISAVGLDVANRRFTSAPVPLIADVVIHPATGTGQAAMSASGTIVYQGASVPTQVVYADARGGVQAIVDDSRPYVYPRLSPDGKKIALTRVSATQRDVWIYDIASRAPTRLTTAGAVNERPEWSPDNKRVLFWTSRGRRAHLWWRPADLSEPESPLLASETEDYFEGVLTPDGKTIVYQIDTAGADVMYRSLAGDTVPRPVANTPFIESQARLSPDGKWVAFVTNESGSDQVVVQPFPGPGARTQVSVNGGREPVWARDGRRLIYRDAQNFVAANVRTTLAFEVTSHDVLMRDDYMRAAYHANYDVSIDGTRLLVIKSTARAQVIIVHNWIDEVRSRLGASAR